MLSRSYPNLDPFSFEFIYRGPLITVNSDQAIYVRSGTYSAQVPVSLEYPIGGDLALQALCHEHSGIVVPLVKLELTNVTQLFRVKVSASVPEGDYHLHWTATGASQESLYTPVRKTKVIVTSAGQVDFSLSTLYPLRQNGSSLPVVFSLPYAPHSDVTVDLALDPPSGFTLQHSAL